MVLYEGITPGEVDYSAVVQKIKRSDAEAVIFGGHHPEASKIVTQMRKKRMDTIFILTVKTYPIGPGFHC